MPVRSTYKMASNTWRGGIGFRPAPGLRRQVLFSFRFRRGTKSLTLSHNSSVNSHDLIPFPVTLFISLLSALSYLRISSNIFRKE
jgi:hypothetical protein